MVKFGKILAALALGAAAIAPVAAQAASEARASSAAKLSVSAAVAAQADDDGSEALFDGGVTASRIPWVLVGLGAITAIVLAIVIASDQEDDVVSP